jgi:hypothetical protein
MRYEGRDEKENSRSNTNLKITLSEYLEQCSTERDENRSLFLFIYLLLFI